MRIDEANLIAGLRLNEWMSLLVFSAAVLYIVVSARRRPGREPLIRPQATTQDPTPEPGEAGRSERSDRRGSNRRAAAPTEAPDGATRVEHLR